MIIILESLGPKGGVGCVQGGVDRACVEWREIINIYGPLGKQWPVKKNHPNINYHEIHLGWVMTAATLRLCFKIQTCSEVELDMRGEVMRLLKQDKEGSKESLSLYRPWQSKKLKSHNWIAFPWLKKIKNKSDEFSQIAYFLTCNCYLQKQWK